MIERWLCALLGVCGVPGYDDGGTWIGYCYLHDHHFGYHESHGGPFR